MAENKNITMKQYNGTDYDVLYPKTKVSQVDGAVASVNNVTPDNTGAVKVDTFEQSIKVGKNVDVGTDGGASAVQFHFDGNSNAYTSRIVESESGALTVDAILKLIQALGIEFGGTGATTAADARTNLGLGAVATDNVVPITRGGTGANSASGACSNLGAVKKSGDTMDGSLVNKSTIVLQRDAYPTFYFNNSAGKNKGAVICSAGAADHNGGIILRGWNSDSSAYKDLVLTYANNMAVPVSNGGTGANNAGDAVKALFDVGPSSQNVSSYPVTPGIYRTVGTNIFSNLTAPHDNYGMLIIFQAGYGLHIYVDGSGRFYWGRSGDSFGEPAKWYGQNTLAPDCYGTALPSAGIAGRIFFKKV